MTTVRINVKSSTYKELLEKTYEELLVDKKDGNKVVKDILSSSVFWKTKYIKDFGRPEKDPELWFKAYEKRHLTETPLYKKLLKLPYRDLVHQEKLPNNKPAISILSDDSFWRRKYLRDYNEPEGTVTEWRELYRKSYNDNLLDSIIRDIYAMLVNDIAYVISKIYEKYNRVVSREILELGYRMGGCRLKKSEDASKVVPEVEMKQEWLLDYEDNEKRRSEMKEEEIASTFRHYLNLTTEVEDSDREYYGAMYVSIFYNGADYVYGTPEIKNENIVYTVGSEPNEVRQYLRNLMKEGTNVISIYMFMSYEDTNMYNWVIDSDDAIAGFRNIEQDEVEVYLRNILPDNTIFPVVTYTTTSMLHTTKCGPWFA